MLLLAVSSSLTLSPVAVGRARPASALTCRTTRSGRCSRPLMLTPSDSGSDTAAAPQINDAARASLRLPAGSPYMNAATAPTAEEELQTLLDAPLFDPWSETPDECSTDTPSGCMPGPQMTRRHGCATALTPSDSASRCPFRQASSGSSRWYERITTWRRRCGQPPPVEM
jgi:hypothetical protein